MTVDHERPQSAPGPGSVAPVSVGEVLPHGASFRFVDRVVEYELGRTLNAELDLREEAPYFAGHFPGRPLMPGVLITEALAQSAGLLLGLTARARRPDDSSPLPQFVLAAAQMKFTRPVAPGITLRLLAESEGELGGLFRCRVQARVADEVVAVGNVTLAAMPGS